jgi:polyferredoxin
MTNFFLTDAGELSLTALAALWALTLLAAIPSVRKMLKTKEGNPRRDQLLKQNALIFFWPLITAVALTAIPFLMVGAILKALQAGAPIWAIGIHAVVVVSGFVSRILNRIADAVTAKFERFFAFVYQTGKIN